jgi:hypothetical protein
MSGMRPNDQMSLPGIGVPVDPQTGHPLKQVIIERLRQLKDAEKNLLAVLHALDGTTMGSRPGDRRMLMAFTKVEEAIMWAEAAILNRGEG